MQYLYTAWYYIVLQMESKMLTYQNGAERRSSRQSKTISSSHCIYCKLSKCYNKLTVLSGFGPSSSCAILWTSSRSSSLVASKSDKLHLTTVLRINIYSTVFFFTSIYIHLTSFFFFFYIGYKVIIKCSGKGILGVNNLKLHSFIFIFVPGNTILKQKKL